MRSAWLEIDLNAYRANLVALREHCGVGLLAVVKANAYGHGLVPVARAALGVGAAALGVALPEEGADLRETGLESLHSARIVVLGLTLPEQAPLLARYRLEPIISDVLVLPALGVASRKLSGRDQGTPLRVHVKVDTGMSRAGAPPEAALALCQAVEDAPDLQLAGLATHFASAEDEDLQSVREQWERFAPLVAAVRKQCGAQPRGAGLDPVCHAANSAAALWFPEARLDWIRPGLVTYGIPPAPRPMPFLPRPVLALKAHLVQVRHFPAGAAIGYGGTYRTSRPSRLAIAPVGYGDGLPWALGNRGHALIHGRRAPIRGRVCMDQVILDVTDISDVRPGDEAVFIGRQGEQEITVPEIARHVGTVTYEILTRLGARLPRVYVGERAE
ncbi:MAG: alanine racemase [Armatimonadetes bacterium]|nr:alanine racemase [Armatimonadota bacterium]